MLKQRLEQLQIEHTFLQNESEQRASQIQALKQVNQNLKLDIDYLKKLKKPQGKLNSSAHLNQQRDSISSTTSALQLLREQEC